MRILVVAVALVLVAACNPPSPPLPPPQPDADAAPSPPAPPAPVADSAPSPSTPCQVACDTLTRLCGPQPADCTTVLAHVDGARHVGTPSGKPLTCAMIVDAGTASAVRALGVGCP